jgi:hypothetical protein
MHNINKTLQQTSVYSWRGFLSGVAQDSICLVYDSVSVGNQILPFEAISCPQLQKSEFLPFPFKMRT